MSTTKFQEAYARVKAVDAEMQEAYARINFHMALEMAQRQERLKYEGFIKELHERRPTATDERSGGGLNLYIDGVSKTLANWQYKITGLRSLYAEVFGEPYDPADFFEREWKNRYGTRVMLPCWRGSSGTTFAAVADDIIVINTPI